MSLGTALLRRIRGTAGFEAAAIGQYECHGVAERSAILRTVSLDLHLRAGLEVGLCQAVVLERVGSAELEAPVGDSPVSALDVDEQAAVRVYRVYVSTAWFLRR